MPKRQPPWIDGRSFPCRQDQAPRRDPDLTRLSAVRSEGRPTSPSRGHPGRSGPMLIRLASWVCHRSKAIPMPMEPTATRRHRRWARSCPPLTTQPSRWIRRTRGCRATVRRGSVGQRTTSSCRAFVRASVTVICRYRATVAERPTRSALTRHKRAVTPRHRRTCWTSWARGPRRTDLSGRPPPGSWRDRPECRPHVPASS